MQIAVDDTSDEEDDFDVYNANCNTTLNRRGHMRLCKDAMTSENLAKQGWRRAHTSGRNSYIFTRKGLVLKIVKHHTPRNDYCSNVHETLYRIRLLCNSMGSLAPRIKHMRVCSWNNEPALTLLMRDEGQTHVWLPSVTDAQVRSVVRRLLRSEIMSRDILTDAVTVNTGNLVIRPSANGHRVSVRFLDVDVPENFVSTSNVPVDLLERVWYKIVSTCLRRRTDPITYAEAEELSSRWSPLFT